MIIYLNAKSIILINAKTVQRHGGNFVPPDNILNDSGLYYVVEAIEATIFGQDAYSTIMDKAAVYYQGIISNHVFQDGNKRTGLLAAQTFLRLNNLAIYGPNGYASPSQFLKGAVQQFVYDFTMEVASGQHDLDSVRAWFAEPARPVG